MVICYLGIGSNLGERRKNIRRAIAKIRQLKGIRIIRLSKIIETQPLGGPPGQPRFLNAVLKIQTDLRPLVLLKSLQKIEKELGRPRNHLFHGPRAIDLDILFYGNELIKTKDLQVPHPRLGERDFLMQPLLETL